jgi:hypothetical protein
MGTQPMTSQIVLNYIELVIHYYSLTNLRMNSQLLVPQKHCGPGNSPF